MCSFSRFEWACSDTSEVLYVLCICIRYTDVSVSFPFLRWTLRETDNKILSPTPDTIYHELPLSLHHLPWTSLHHTPVHSPLYRVSLEMYVTHDSNPQINLRLHTTTSQPVIIPHTMQTCYTTHYHYTLLSQSITTTQIYQHSTSSRPHNTSARHHTMNKCRKLCRREQNAFVSSAASLAWTRVIRCCLTLLPCNLNSRARISSTYAWDQRYYTKKITAT